MGGVLGRGHGLREDGKVPGCQGLGQYHHALEGLGQRKLLVAILDPKDHEGHPVHVLPIQEPAREEDFGY